jgi:hypothetical protein
MSLISISRGSFVNRRSQTPQSMRYSLPRAFPSSGRTPSTIYEARKEVARSFHSALAEAVREAAHAGWDGHGSNAADVGALTRVMDFLEALPDDFPFPDPSVTPNGDILLEWSKSPQLSLAVLFGSVGQIHYASYIRGLKTYGAFDFVGDELSQEFVVVATRWWQSK